MRIVNYLKSDRCWHPAWKLAEVNEKVMRQTMFLLLKSVNRVCCESVLQKSMYRAVDCQRVFSVDDICLIKS